MQGWAGVTLTNFARLYLCIIFYFKLLLISNEDIREDFYKIMSQLMLPKRVNILSL